MSLRTLSIALAVAATALLGTAAFAQGDAGKDPGHVKQRLAHLTKALELSEAQQKQIEPILAKEGEDIRRVFEESRGKENQRDAVGKELKALRERNDAKIRELLDEDQRASFDALREQQRERAKAWGH